MLAAAQSASAACVAAAKSLPVHCSWMQAEDFWTKSGSLQRQAMSSGWQNSLSTADRQGTAQAAGGGNHGGDGFELCLLEDLKYLQGRDWRGRREAEAEVKIPERATRRAGLQRMLGSWKRKVIQNLREWGLGLSVQTDACPPIS
jgi:hypothetical protein